MAISMGANPVFVKYEAARKRSGAKLGQTGGKLGQKVRKRAQNVPKRGQKNRGENQLENYL